MEMQRGLCERDLQPWKISGHGAWRKGVEKWKLTRGKINLAGTSESGFFEVREVKSENKKLSLLFEKCKVKKNAFPLFQEVQSEKKMLSLFFEK